MRSIGYAESVLVQMVLKVVIDCA